MDKMAGIVIPAKEGRIVMKEGRKRMSLKVVSKGDRPIQVGRMLNMVDPYTYHT